MVDVRCSVHGKWWSVSQRSELLVDEVGRDIVRLALPFVAHCYSASLCRDLAYDR